MTIGPSIQNHQAIGALAELFKVIAHPDRIRIIKKLREDETDVNSLAETLSLPGPRTSQHLRLLRAYKLVEERRRGRHHIYRLTQPHLAQWIDDGLNVMDMS
ncbi:MAG: metalloregulator ArsR/SmtB family transcription factor [Pseudomonadota bacterium]